MGFEHRAHLICLQSGYKIAFPQFSDDFFDLWILRSPVHTYAINVVAVQAVPNRRASICLVLVEEIALLLGVRLELDLLLVTTDILRAVNANHRFITGGNVHLSCLRCTVFRTSNLSCSET